MVDVCGGMLYPLIKRIIYKHIGVGFCVARSDRKGNAEASKCGMSNKYRFPRSFFMCFSILWIKYPLGESAGATLITMRTAVFSVVSACAFMLMISCGGSKQAAQSGKKYTNPFEAGVFELPCAVYDDENYFAATGIASGPATQKDRLVLDALTNAQSQVQMKMEHAVMGEVKSYYESIGSNEGTDIDDRTENGIKRAIMGVVNNTSYCCLKFSGVDEKGNVECYLGIKISKNEISEAVSDNLSQSKKEDIRQHSNDFFNHLSESLKDYIEE